MFPGMGEGMKKQHSHSTETIRIESLRIETLFRIFFLMDFMRSVYTLYTDTGGHKKNALEFEKWRKLAHQIQLVRIYMESSFFHPRQQRSHSQIS